MRKRPPPPGAVEEVVAAAITAAWTGDENAMRELVAMLDEASAEPTFQRGVSSVVERRLVGAISDLWPKGWQPVDVAGVVDHRLSRRHVRLAIDAVGSQSRSYDAATEGDPGWLSQLEELSATPWWDLTDSHLPQWAAREGVAWAEAVRVAAELLALLGQLPPIAVLRPPPSEWGRPGAILGRRQGVDSKILARVRSLLAKAESTSFPAEAEALTAKAQELMTRHALDQAMLAGGGHPTEKPAVCRIRADNPYAGAKAILLDQVARTNRCRSVWSSGLGFCEVLGFPADLEIVEVLFTSLLVQGTTAMLAAGAAPGARRQRSRSFRQSFLIAYAGRIGERLRDTNAAGFESAERRHGEVLLPVLRSRAAAVDEAFEAAFPALGKHKVSANDMAGHLAGRVAADLASLAVGDALQKPA